MLPSAPLWERRILRIVLATEWIGLAVGIVVALAVYELEPVVFIAGGLAGVWVIAATSIPLDVQERPLGLDTLVLTGVILTMTAVTLTDATSSPFLLLSFTPAIHASAIRGYRPGLTSALLSSALLIAVDLAAGVSTATSLGVAVLYLVLAATVAQIRRILDEVEHRAVEAETSSTAIAERLESLESANSLLARLADISATQELNPISIGRVALEAVVGRYPGSSAVAAIAGPNGPIFVARYGTIPADGSETRIPLEVGEREVGFVRLTTPDALGDAELDALRIALRPLALAFSNALLLQSITRDAVTEERTRLARELHDEIGPSLASLGLSLDVALIQGSDQRELTEHLSELRGRVGRLVDDVRSTVSDLRAGSMPSLRTHLADILAELPDAPRVRVDVDERRPARPSMAGDLHAIVTEAVRNAVRHSAGSEVSVRGWVDFDRGFVVVEDDGHGFDDDDLPAGHFGLMGMRERAEQSGIGLQIKPGPDGTRVEVEWGATT